MHIFLNRFCRPLGQIARRGSDNKRSSSVNPIQKGMDHPQVRFPLDFVLFFSHKYVKGLTHFHCHVLGLITIFHSLDKSAMY